MNQIKYLEYLVDEIHKYGPLENFNEYSISCNDVEYVLNLLKSLLNYGLHVIDIDTYEKYLTIHKNLLKIQLIDACNSTQMDRPLIQRKSIDPVINYDLFPLNDNDIETIKQAFSQSTSFENKSSPDEDDDGGGSAEDKKEHQKLRNNIIKSHINFSHEQVYLFRDTKERLLSGLEAEFYLMRNNFSESFRNVDLTPNKLKSFLLYGPPGSGKSSLVRYLGMDMYNEISGLFSVSTSRIKSKYVGESGKNIRALFEVCREFVDKYPDRICVIFLDEIDTLFPDDPSQSSDIQTEFLVEMEGLESGSSSKGKTIKSNRNIVLIAATNYPASIPSNILSRFVTKIRVSIPYPVLSTQERLLYLSDDTFNIEHIQAIRRINFEFCKNPSMFIQNFLIRYRIPNSLSNEDYNDIMKKLWNQSTPATDSGKITEKLNDKFSKLSYLTQRGMNNFLTLLWKEMMGKTITLIKQIKVSEFPSVIWIRWVINEPKMDERIKTSIKYIPTNMDEDENEDIECVRRVNDFIPHNEDKPHIIQLCSLMYDSAWSVFKYKILDDHENEWIEDDKIEENISAPVIKVNDLIKSIKENYEVLVTKIDQSMIDKIWEMDPEWIPTVFMPKDSLSYSISSISSSFGTSTKFDMTHIYKVINIIFPEEPEQQNKIEMNMTVNKFWYSSDRGYYVDMLGCYLGDTLGKNIYLIQDIKDKDLNVFIRGWRTSIDAILLYNESNCIVFKNEGSFYNEWKDNDYVGDHEIDIQSYLIHKFDSEKYKIALFVFNKISAHETNKGNVITYKNTCDLRYIGDENTYDKNDQGFHNLGSIYFQKQEKMFCGAHAINNMLGFDLVECDELFGICDTLMENNLLKKKTPITYCDSTGNFRSEVLYCSLYNKKYFTYNIMVANAINSRNLELITGENLKGFLINGRGHWTAIQYNEQLLNTKFIYIDSMNKNITRFMTSDDMIKMFQNLESYKIEAILVVYDRQIKIDDDLIDILSEEDFKNCSSMNIDEFDESFDESSSMNIDTFGEFDESFEESFDQFKEYDSYVVTDLDESVSHMSIYFIRQSNQRLTQSGPYAINNLLGWRAISAEQLNEECVPGINCSYNSIQDINKSLTDIYHFPYLFDPEMKLRWNHIIKLITSDFIGFLINKDNKWIAIKKWGDELGRKTKFIWIDSIVDNPKYYSIIDLIGNLADYEILAIYKSKVKDEDMSPYHIKHI